MATKQKQNKKEEEEKIKVDVTELETKANKKITPKIMKTVTYYRVEKGMAWHELVKKIESKYDIKVTPLELSNAYEDETAKATVISEKGNKVFNRQIEEMEERFEDIWNTVDRLHQAAKKLLDEFEAQSETEMKAYINFLKVSPTILNIIREIKSQIEFIRDQNQTYIEKQENYIYSPIQIMTKVNQYLKTLVRDGDIVIKSEDLAKKIKEMKGGEDGKENNKTSN